MPGDIDELRRRVLIARVTKKRQAEAVPEEEEPGLFSQAMTGVKDNFVDKAKAVGGLFTGTSPAENIPLVGPLMRKGANYASAALIAPFTDKSVGDIYDESEAHDAGTAKKEMRENPGAQELKSTLGSFALPLPGSMTNKFIPEATGAVAKFGRGLLGAGEAAGVNAGISYGDARARDLSHEEAKDAAQNAALISGGINSAIPAAKLMGKAYSRVVANIKPDTLEHYRGNRDAINTMKPTDAYEEFSGAANTIRNKADALENQTKNSIESDRQRGMAEGTYRQQAANAKAEAERATGLSKSDQIKEYVRKKMGDNESAASAIQRDTAENLSKAQTGARKAINDSAFEAMKLAEESGAEIPIKGFKASLTRRLNDYNVGDIRVGPGVPMLEKLRSNLDQIGKPTLSAIELRTLIKSLDQEVESAMVPGKGAGYTSPVQRDLLGVRHGWSEEMKDVVPGYREAQAQTAGKTQAMKGMQDHFSYEPDALYKELDQLDQPHRMDRRQSLQKFQDEFGGDFDQRMAEARALKNEDFTPYHAEADELRKRDYHSPYKMDMDIGEAMKRKDYAAPYAGEFEKAQNTRDLSKRITDEDSAMAFLEKYGRDPERAVARGKQMRGMANELGLDENHFTTMGRNLAVKRGMEGGMMHGSRNVQGGKSTGELLDKHLGGTGLFKTIGAWAGLASDVLGKTVVKKVVDVMDSQRGQVYMKGLSEAARRGPQAITVWHNLKLKNDPAYKQLMDEENQ